jgi:hypothetical protein
VPQDFDIRDRARMMRGILLGGSSPMVRDKAEGLFLKARAAPEFEAPSKGKSQFVLNTLSHVVSHQVTGYMPIGDHPEEVPDAAIREPITTSDRGGERSSGSASKHDKRQKKEVKDFYKSDDSDTGDSDDSGESGSDSDSSSKSDDSGSSSDEDESASDSRCVRG